MRLTNEQLDRVLEAGCVVEKATRFETDYWNSHRGDDEPRIYGGYYWWLKKRGRAETDLFGPYRTPMASFSAAYDELVLGRRGKRLAFPARIPASGRSRRVA